MTRLLVFPQVIQISAGGGPSSSKQSDEVAVLAHDHSAFGASGEEDLTVACLPHAKGAERTGFVAQLRIDPSGKAGRELSVDPDPHAPSTG